MRSKNANFTVLLPIRGSSSSGAPTCRPKCYLPSRSHDATMITRFSQIHHFHQMPQNPTFGTDPACSGVLSVLAGIGGSRGFEMVGVAFRMCGRMSLSWPLVGRVTCRQCPVRVLHEVHRVARLNQQPLCAPKFHLTGILRIDDSWFTIHPADTGDRGAHTAQAYHASCKACQAIRVRWPSETLDV